MYGEQRFEVNSRELTAEEQARQFLAVEAMKEQARYERAKRRELVQYTKDAVSFLFKLSVIAIIAFILAFTVGCEKPSDEPIGICPKLVEVYLGNTLDGNTEAVIYRFSDGTRFVAVKAGEYYDAPKDKCELEKQMADNSNLYRW